MTRKFNIYLGNEIVFQTFAATAEDALNEFAGYRSGYETFSEMCRSATFADLREAYAA